MIDQCGPFGRYQWIHTCFLLLFPVASGIVNYYFIFGAAEPGYTCQLIDQLNATGQIRIDQSQCFYYTIDEFNQTQSKPCSRWTYDQTVFGKTFTEEANFVCQHRFHRSLLASALQIGAMFIFFTGQLTDVLGRRRAMSLLVGLFLSVSLVTQTLLQFVPMTINQK